MEFSGSTYDFLEFAKILRRDRRHVIQTLDFRHLVAVKSEHVKDLALHEEVLNAFYILDTCCELQFVKFLVMDGIDDWELPPVSSEDDLLTTGSYTSPSPTEDDEESDAYTITSRRPSLASSIFTSTSDSTNLQGIAEQTLGWSLFDNLSQAPPRQLPQIIKQMGHSLRTILPTLFSVEGCSMIDGMRVVCFPSFLCEALAYLDLSYTATSETWIRSFSDLPLQQIRVLKLRGLRLTDRALPRFALNNGHKLWSLDLRDNVLTDAAINYLLTSCFLPKLPQRVGDVGLYQLPPVYERDLDQQQDLSDGAVARPDTKRAFMKYIKMDAHASDLDEMDHLLHPTGLTHLYLSDNRFTSKGIERLLHETNRLQVVDVGTVRDTSATDFTIRHAIPWALANITPSLQRMRSPRLSSLRIHHSIVTCTPTVTTAATGPDRGSSPSSYSAQHLFAAEEFGQVQSTRGAEKTFSPLNHNGIETLTLTGLAAKSPGFVVQKLADFLAGCHQQEEDLNQARADTHRRAPQVLPGLRTLRLEFLSEDIAVSSATAGSSSVSGDRDAETFFTRSRDDFSFFDDVPSIDPQTFVADKPAPQATNELKDVVEELRKMRKEGSLKWGGRLEIVLPHTAC
jgi:hypothetical protein